MIASTRFVPKNPVIRYTLHEDLSRQSPMLISFGCLWNNSCIKVHAYFRSQISSSLIDGIMNHTC